MIVRTDYRAVNGKGVCLYTFGDEATALLWAEENAPRHDLVSIERVDLVATTVRTYWIEREKAA